MRNLFTQRKLALLFSSIVIPFIFALPFLMNRTIDENYTGFINLDVLPWWYYLLASISYTVLIYLLYKAGKFNNNWHIYIFVFSILSILSICIPYHIYEDFYSGLHVLVSFVTWVLLNCLVYVVVSDKSSLKMLFLFTIALTVFLTITFNRVNGLIEWIYLFGISSILHIINVKFIS